MTPKTPGGPHTLEMERSTGMAADITVAGILVRYIPFVDFYFPRRGGRCRPRETGRDLISDPLRSVGQDAQPCRLVDFQPGGRRRFAGLAFGEDADLHVLPAAFGVDLGRIGLEFRQSVGPTELGTRGLGRRAPGGDRRGLELTGPADRLVANRPFLGAASVFGMKALP
jgi:hypothetical protein